MGQSGHIFKKLYLLKNIIKTVPFLVSSVVVMFLMFKKEKKKPKTIFDRFPIYPRHPMSRLTPLEGVSLKLQ